MRLNAMILAMVFLAMPAQAGQKRGFKDGVTRDEASVLCVSAYQYLEGTGEGWKKKEQAARDYWIGVFEGVEPDNSARQALVEVELEKYREMKKRTPVILANVYVSSCVDEMKYEIAQKREY